MPKPKPHTLLCTVGTSLFFPNLSGLTREPQTDPIRAALAKAYKEKDWLGVATQLFPVRTYSREAKEKEIERDDGTKANCH